MDTSEWIQRKHQFVCIFKDLLRACEDAQGPVNRIRACLAILSMATSNADLVRHVTFRRFLIMMRWKLSELRASGLNHLMVQITMNHIRCINLCEFTLPNPVHRLGTETRSFLDPFCSRLFYQPRDSTFVVCPHHHLYIERFRAVLDPMLSVRDLVNRVLEFLFSVGVTGEQRAQLKEYNSLLVLHPPLVSVPSVQVLLRQAGHAQPDA